MISFKQYLIESQDDDLPNHFNTGEDFYHFIHYGMNLNDPYCEHQGGGAWVAYDGENVIGTYDEHSGQVLWGDEEI